MLVLFFSQIGVGYSGMQALGSILGTEITILGTEIMHLTTYQQKNPQDFSRSQSTADLLQRSCDVVRRVYGHDTEHSSSDEIINIGVSFDGSWLTRGHRSKYGIGAVIDVVTGHVIDYEVLCNYCQQCTAKAKTLGIDTVNYREWFAGHKNNCYINFTGSSNSMEVEAAKRLWSRSIVRNKMRYTNMLGDGDSKAYSAVKEMKPYGDITIERDECVNHAHKRLGTALRKLTQSLHLGGRGKGRLTLQKCSTLQNYYRGAIINNIGSPTNMRKAVWATLYHCMSTNDDPHHDNCPDSVDSWCLYNRSISLDQPTPCHSTFIKTVLAPEVAQAMTPIYQRMSDPNLLERLSKGKTLMRHFMVLYGLVVQKQFLLEGHVWKHPSLVELRPSMLEPVTQVMS